MCKTNKAPLDAEHLPESPLLVLGVTGSIAAYKAADLTSRLRQAGVEVQVIMTAAAQKLVCPQTFCTLSRHPVITDLWMMPDWQPGHVELAMRAVALLVMPATANIIGKMAHGIADDALSTYYLSHVGQVYVAPAMNPRMWAHPAVQANCRILTGRGVHFIGPVAGPVACGEAGLGRLAAVDEIFAVMTRALKPYFEE
ncbi:MAG TPA: flavoprotein [Lentisphaeria bacterium]|nr:phosphopantothenoylcysteine decarboxylase [Lentisphaerota bacterium]OQC14206.1 MAG: Coenzyme A biosynthesis bifunctional protein CoaBC [Lentisphaerae bacterium ADurb.Bin082]HQC52214.1 flavoprotein [Lentisphaeria bacterium]HQL86835.1 flavoprotein [Lentisphaeria bacterium]